MVAWRAPRNARHRAGARGTGGCTWCLRRSPGFLGRCVDSAGKDVSDTHHRTDIMANLFGSPRKVVLVVVVLLVAVVLIGLFGSRKLPGSG
jgi:hypothetical protein